MIMVADKRLTLFFIYFLLAIAFSTSCLTLKADQIGLAPDISIGYKVSDNFSLATKIESFNTFYSFGDNVENEAGYIYEGTDIQFFGNYRLNPFWRVALGYQLNTGPDNAPEHRTIQQITYTRRPEGILFGHRFRTDQTYYTDEITQYRVRYRFSVEFPLQGLSVNDGEFYMGASDELIFATQAGENQLENRLVYWLGYQLQGGNEIQTGFDYRADTGNDHDLWFKISWNVRL